MCFVSLVHLLDTRTHPALGLTCLPLPPPQELVAAVARHSPGLPEALSTSPRFAALLAGNGELARAIARDEALAAALADDGRWGRGGVVCVFVRRCLGTSNDAFTLPTCI